MGIGRRTFLKLVGAGGLAATLPPFALSCGKGGSPAGSERRTLHFDLSTAHPGAELTLHLGGRTIRLETHDQGSRAEHRLHRPWLGLVPDDHLTHFVDADFPTDAPQSFFVSYRHPDPTRLPYMATAGVQVPAAARAAAPVLYAAKLRRLRGLRPQDDALDGGAVDTIDFADWVDMIDAAQYVVCHHPELISIDPAVMATVLQHIGGTRSFDALVESLILQGQAQGIDGWEEGYEGWANAQHLLDRDGNKIPDGNGGYRWWWTYTDETKAAMGPVVRQALLAVRDDRTLEGKRYETLTGIHSVDGEAPAAARHYRTATAANGGYTYAVDHEDWDAGRKVEITGVAGRTITVKVHNSYFRHLGVHVQYRNVDGAAIKLAELSRDGGVSSCDTESAAYLGFLNSRARLLGIPLEDETAEEYTFTLPEPATSARILCSSLGNSALGSLDTFHADYGSVETVGAVMTAVFELGLPSFLLLMGVAGMPLLAPPAKGLLVDLAKLLIEIAATVAARQGSGDPEYDTAFALEIISDLIKGAAAPFMEFMAWAGAMAAEKAVEHSVPVAGIIIWAIESVGTIAEIVETAVDAGISPWVIPAYITSTHDVVVTVHHDPNDYQLPAAATHYRLVAAFSDKITYTIGYDRPKTLAPGAQSIVATCGAVPSGGTVKVTVELLADNGAVVGRGASDVLANLNPAGQTSLPVEITITEYPAELSAQTSYSHQARLDLSSDRHVWVTDAKAPLEVVPALSCASVGTALCESQEISVGMCGRLAYSWRAASPTLASCDTGATAAQLFTLQSLALDSPDPDTSLRILRCGFTLPVFLALSLEGPLEGQHFIVAPVWDPAAGRSWYHARKVPLGGTAPYEPAKVPSWGCFASDRIRQVVVHPTGRILALHADWDKVEILRLPAAPYATDAAAVFARQAAGKGANVGLLDTARAIAPTLDGQSFIVLEEGNRRLQAFTVNGVSVPYFKGGRPVVPLAIRPEDAGSQLTYTDLAIEAKGYLYVLSYVGAGRSAQDFHLDLYEPDGTWLARTSGVTAAKLVVDRWRTLYTLNYQLLKGPGGRPEPSVSRWVPSWPTPATDGGARDA
jgi:hypothetical protein